MRTCIVLIVSFFCCSAMAQPAVSAAGMADMVIKNYPVERFSKGAWAYDQGVVYGGMLDVWQSTGDPKYFDFIQKNVDAYIDNAGDIRSYELDKHRLDDVLNGRAALMLYKVTGKEKYLKAVQRLREQLRTQPRNSFGGFWHKDVYPNQMWLDGLYMGAPFYAAYADYFHDDTAFNDIAKQFALCQEYMRDAASGLLYHGWDASRKEAWANKQTGLSQNFWARAMGWYGMALVDVLDYYPDNNPHKKELVGYVKQYIAAIAHVQDTSGLWWDILNMPGKQGNYLEASASCMFVYTIAKAVRMHYVDRSFASAAAKGLQGIESHFIKKDTGGDIVLAGTVSVSGLGGKPDKYRDGSYRYYMSEKVVDNDLKGIGAFIQAASEAGKLPQLQFGYGKKVLLDSYFNNETQKDKATGGIRSFHYKWEEMDNNGYSIWGEAFRSFGAEIFTSYNAPSPKTLQGYNVYVISDPDIPSENPNPEYMMEKDADAIYRWVKAGGTLVLMTNDSGNADIVHTNILAKKLGFTFNNNSVNHVPGHVFDSGAVIVAGNNPVFSHVSEVYMKEVSTIAPTSATVVLQKYGNTIAVTAAVGKGRVFAVGDPWFYNEYTDGRKLPLQYQNFKAMKDLTQWLLSVHE